MHSILKDLDVSLSSEDASSIDLSEKDMSARSRKQRRILAEAKSDARDSHSEFNR